MNSRIFIDSALFVTATASHVVTVFKEESSYFNDDWQSIFAFYLLSFAVGLVISLLLGQSKNTINLSTPLMIFFNFFVYIVVIFGDVFEPLAPKIILMVALVASFIFLKNTLDKKHDVKIRLFLTVFLFSIFLGDAINFGLFFYDQTQLKAGMVKTSKTQKSADGITRKVNESDVRYIFHLMFDGMSGKQFVEEDYYARNGFHLPLQKESTLFKYAYTNGHQTGISLPQVFTGKYMPENNDITFDRVLYDNGWQVNYFHSTKHVKCLPDASTCMDRKYAYAQVRFRENRLLEVKFHLKRSLYVYLKRIKQNWLYDHIVKISQIRGRDNVIEGQSASVILYEEFLRFVDSVPKNTYAIAHIMIPHGPHIHNSECKLIGDESQLVESHSNRSAGYKEQLKCANYMIERFIKKLKEKNIYDESLIVIHSDHGSAVNDRIDEPSYFEVIAQRDINNLNAQEVTEERGRVFLWVKPVGKKNKNIENYMVNLIDVSPYILDQVGLIQKFQNVDGTSFENPATPVERDIFASGAMKFPSGKHERYFLKREMRGGLWKFIDQREYVTRNQAPDSESR